MNESSNSSPLDAGYTSLRVTQRDPDRTCATRRQTRAQKNAVQQRVAPHSVFTNRPRVPSIVARSARVAVRAGCLSCWAFFLCASQGCQGPRFRYCEDTEDCETLVGGMTEQRDSSEIMPAGTVRDSGEEGTSNDAQVLVISSASTETAQAGLATDAHSGEQTNAGQSLGAAPNLTGVSETRSAMSHGETSMVVTSSDVTNGPELEPSTGVSSDAIAPSSGSPSSTRPTPEEGTGSTDPGGGGTWTPESSVPVGVNLITNGNFSDGPAFWTIEQEGSIGLVQLDTSGGNLCFRGFYSANLVVGWPREAVDSLQLPAGTYTLAFRVQSERSRLWAKVGHAYEPYQTFFEVEWNGEARGWSQQRYDFVLDGDDAVGVAFIIQLEDEFGGDSLCLDDVSLELKHLGSDS